MALSNSPPSPPSAVDDALAVTRAALARGDVAGAVAAAEAALSRGVRHPHLYNLLAYGLEEAGRLDDAFTVLQQALVMAPQDPQILHAVGLCLYKMARPAEAIVAFDGALLHRPDFAPSLHHKGLAQHALGNPAAAARSFARAVDLDPFYPDPRAALASLACDRGDSATARWYGQEALALDKANPAALLALARADFIEGAADVAESRVRSLLKEKTLLDADRPAVLALLGDILDEQGRYAEAYAAFCATNEAAEKVARPRGALADDYPARAALAAEVLNGLTVKDAAPSPATARPGAGAEERPGLHVFLLGFPCASLPRLEDVLGGHPGATMLRDRATLEDLAREFLTSNEGYRRLFALEGEGLERARARYWRRLAEGGVDSFGPVFIDKLALNTLTLALIGRLFPDAAILFCVRDPRDVVLSCFRRPYQMKDGMEEFSSIERAARFYDAVMRAGEAARHSLPLKLSEVRYEAAVEDLRGTVSNASAFLGLVWEEGALDAAVGAGPHGAQRPATIHPEGVGRWRRYQEQLKPALPVLEPWLRRFGYSDLA